VAILLRLPLCGTLDYLAGSDHESIRGVDSLYEVTWVVVPLLTRVVWPEILVIVNEIFPTAANALFNLLILLGIIVSIALLSSQWN
jgi:hypothetical protein